MAGDAAFHDVVRQSCPPIMSANHVRQSCPPGMFVATITCLAKDSDTSRHRDSISYEESRKTKAPALPNVRYFEQTSFEIDQIKSNEVSGTAAQLGVP